jgi:hypothetical protein
MRRGKGRGTEVCSNGQRAVDSKSKRIMAHDVTNETGDRAWRSPMALRAQAGLGCPCDAVAEVGSSHGEAVQTWLAAGITPYVARPSTSAHATLGLCSKDDCRDDPATDPSQCPAGAPLTCRCDAVEPGRPIRSDATSACRAGPLTPQGTRNQGGRRLPRGVAEYLWAAMEQRVRRRPEGMKQRKQ